MIILYRRFDVLWNYLVFRLSKLRMTYTMFKAGYPHDSVDKAHIRHTELLYEYEDSYKEKFKKVDIGAELKLSVLMGLITFEGSRKYLSDVKESLRSVKDTLIDKMTSVG